MIKIEDTIQISFVKWAEENNVKAYMLFQDVGVFKKAPGFPQIVNRLLHMGLRKGVADMLVFTQKRMFFIEFKTETGELSTFQKQFIERTEKKGINTYVCRSLQEAINVCIE